MRVDSHLLLKKVIVLKTEKQIYQGDATCNKMQITVLIAASVSGHYVKPLIISVQPRTQLHEDFHWEFPGELFGNSPSGWMDGSLSSSWIEHRFQINMEDCKVKKPLISFINSARSHISIETAEFCKANDIILYTLFLNAKHLIQVLDLIFMNIVKMNYWEEVWLWWIANPGEAYDKYVLINVFKKVWEKSVKVECTIKGFKEAGIFH